MNLESAKRFIESHHDFLLAAHRSPDGDTLGSCLALRLGLIALGKRADVVCADEAPKYLRFLSGSDTVLHVVKSTPEAVLYVDCADHSRVGAIAAMLEQAPYAFGIDHHTTNPRESKNGDWVESVGATGELIYRLLTALNVPITMEIAECLFTALATDTGNFAYSNTTPDTFRIAGELCKTGIDLSELNRILFRTIPVQKSRLIARVLETAALYENDRIAIACITRQDLAETHADEAYCEGLVDYLRDMEPVEIACVMRESADGSIRGSLRAKRFADVSAPAKALGGGGHPRAAGFTMNGPLSEARETVLQMLRASIQAWKES